MRNLKNWLVEGNKWDTKSYKVSNTAAMSWTQLWNDNYETSEQHKDMFYASQQIINRIHKIDRILDIKVSISLKNLFSSISTKEPFR